jgi:hypothetical protein
MRTPEPAIASRQPPVGNLWLDGSRGSCTRAAEPVEYGAAAACATFSSAYASARPGDRVLVKGGTYRERELQAPPKGDPNADEPDVHFSAAPGERVAVHDIEVFVPHVTFEGIDLLEAAFKYRSDGENERAGDITVSGSDGHSMTITSVWNFTLRDSDVGPQIHPGQPDDDTQDALFIGAYPVDDGHHPKNLTIDNVTFHDVVRPYEAAHSDCLQLTAGENVTVARSTFYNCADAGIIPKNDQGPIRDLLIENSFIGATVNASEEINFYDTGRPCGDVVIRHNSVVGTIRIDGGEQPTDCTLSVVGNVAESLSETRCNTSQATRLEHNVWESGMPCGPRNHVVSGGDAGYVNRSNDSSMDLRLRDGSAAIDRGDPADHPPLDHDGNRRYKGAAPDAGAHEAG